ncbi:MAG: prepilin peptidase [Acetatifactor sp.]|nr:prepilin peptidase [Acetatifactor sp.]
MIFVSKAVVFVLLFFACIYDYRQGRIPNRLILCLIGVSVASAGVITGLSGIGHFLGQMLLVGGLLFILFHLDLLGAGDVKLIGVSAGLVRSSFLFSFCYIILLIAAGFSAVVLFQKYIFHHKDKKGVRLAGPVFLGFLFVCLKGGYFA